jgi:hypothetical protein
MEKNMRGIFPRTLLCLSLFSLGVAAGGCQRGPTFTEVGGTVKLNGKALSGVMVQFLPEPETGGSAGPRSTAVTDEEGRYTLATDDGQPGAVVGNHRVLVSDIIDSQPTDVNKKRKDRMDANVPLHKVPKSRVPKRYEEANNTPLRVEVKPNSAPIDLNVTSP